MSLDHSPLSSFSPSPPSPPASISFSAPAQLLNLLDFSVLYLLFFLALSVALFLVMGGEVDANGEAAAAHSTMLASCMSTFQVRGRGVLTCAVVVAAGIPCLYRAAVCTPSWSRQCGHPQSPSGVPTTVLLEDASVAMCSADASPLAPQYRNSARARFLARIYTIHTHSHTHTSMPKQITLANGDYQLYEGNGFGVVLYISWTILSTLLLLSLLIAILSYDFQVCGGGVGWGGEWVGWVGIGSGVGLHSCACVRRRLCE